MVQPLGEAPDEADHYAYVRYLGLNHSLPVGPEVTQSKHPPLYHTLAAALTTWTGLDFDFLRSNPDAFPLGPEAPPNFFVHTTLESFPWRGGALAMHLGRLLSVLLGAVTVWAAWRLGSEAFPQHAFIGLLAAAFLAGLPGFLYISGAMNNDNAAGAFGSLILLLCVRIIWRGVSVGAHIGARTGDGARITLKGGDTGVVAAGSPGSSGSLFGRSVVMVRAWARAVGHLALAWGLGLLIASPWLLRNWQLYGDPLGWALVRATVDQRLAPLTFADLIWLARGLFGYFWGRFGPIGQVRLPEWAYPTALGFTLFVLIGIFAYLRRYLSSALRQARGLRPPTSDLRPLSSLLLLAAAPLLLLASIVQYSTIALGTDQARLLWPAIAAIAVWVGVGLTGWVEWLRPQAQRWLVPGFIIVMTTYGLATLLFVVRPAFAPPPPALPSGAVAAEKLATFGAGFDLVAAELPSEPVAIGQPIAFTLLWRTRQPLTDDLRPVVRLVHSDGWLAAEWDHSPAQGRYSTDRWRSGEIIADPYVITPHPASAGDYRLEVGVRPFRGDWLPIMTGADAEEGFLVLGTIAYR